MHMFHWILPAALIAGCIYLNLRGFMKLDKNHGMEFKTKTWILLLAGSLVAAGIWIRMTDGDTVSVKTAWMLIQIYFVLCSLTDILTCQVYDICQYPAVAAAAFLALQGPGQVEMGISILLFVGLQYGIFMRLYGAADGMALLVAALAECSMGYDINIYLFHMIMAYLLMGVLQAFRGNIGIRGRLKRPVPFVPYITVSFWIILIFGEKVWYTYIQNGEYFQIWRIVENELGK